ncbi:unnamed protein product [Thlaspi arvense]|uniref:FRIGIDA-like protein n=1 Tax=Thlaspi arvense TaxID=13288 RepID=A0AAU9RRK0_THLAR|nr:unnamed protein product [Thlaspi arvense]
MGLYLFLTRVCTTSLLFAAFSLFPTLLYRPLPPAESHTVTTREILLGSLLSRFTCIAVESMGLRAMDNTCVEDKFTFVSKRQKLCESLEKLKADSSQILKTLHDHYDMVAEKRSRDIELKEDELQVLCLKLEETQKKIEATEIEAGDKEKELDLLRKQIKSEEKTLTEIRTSLKNTQNELELKKTELRARSSVLVKHDVAAETGDALTLREFSSASLSRHQVSSYLRGLSNPAKFVLDLVKGQLKDAHRGQDLGLQGLVLENLVLSFEELAEIRGTDKAQMRLKATQVATLWKGMMVIEAPRSTLEALAFLLFIVAYGLRSLINEEETALLATSVFNYKQGPRLFHLFGLKRKLPVRIICLLKLKEFSATTLLMKEITSLRCSALEKAEIKDVGRLRAIVELVADYKLDIDLPGDLIAKLMFPREDSTPPALHCSVEAAEETCPSSSNPMAT